MMLNFYPTNVINVKVWVLVCLLPLQVKTTVPIAMKIDI